MVHTCGDEGAPEAQISRAYQTGNHYKSGRPHSLDQQHGGNYEAKQTATVY